MENKIGYAVITTVEYKEMIEDIKNKEEYIKKLNAINKEENEIYKKLQEYFFKKIAENEDYHLKNMKECNPTDYHYQELYKCFLESGINNAQYIHNSIASLKFNFDNGRFKTEE